MPSKASNNSAKPKSSRKRRQPLNYNPKSIKKRSAASRKSDQDEVDSDLEDVEIKDETKQRNEERESGKQSEEDEETSNVNKGTQLLVVRSRAQRTLTRRRTPGMSQRNTSLKISSTSAAIPQYVSISPELVVEGENSLQSEGGFSIQTDKTFLQQQIQLLETSFSLQDCPDLLGKQSKRKNFVPRDIMEDGLRKLNHKMNDEIQKHLNRQCQRKVLSELLEVEKDNAECENQEEQKDEYVVEKMSVSEILEKCSDEIDNNRDTDRNLLRKYSNTLAELRGLSDEMTTIKQKIASYESNKLMVSEVERLAREATQKSLRKELERTNKLVNQITRILRREADSV